MKDLKKDAFLVALILAAALLLYAVNALLPKHTVEGKTAEITMAPDAVEIVNEATAAPEAAAVPEATAAPEATATPEVTAEPEATAAPEVTAVPEATAAPESTAVPETTEAPAAAAQPQAVAGPAGPMMPAAQETKVKGHVLITLNGRQYGDPIPMDREKVITIRQDGGMVNKVHITPDAVWMESSTCENQDCVGEGEITLDNYKTRILSTYIICMPNGVSVEMIPEDQD